MEKILVLEKQYFDTLGALRGITSLKAAVDTDGLIWLRGIPASITIDKRIASLPVCQKYTLDKDERLFPEGGKTPTAKLPQLDWQALNLFIPIELPVSALPGKVMLPMDVRLSRSTSTRQPFALLTELVAWKAYAEHAPETRLRQLRFAVRGDGQTLIIGTPLPQLPGQTYWAQEQLLLPSGYDLDPPILATLIEPPAEELLLFSATGTWESIPLNAFQPARRSAVRLTQVDHG